MARVYLKGLPQLKAKLRRLQTDTADDIKPTLGQAAQKIVDLMKRLVPVDDGDLRDSIDWTFGDAPQGAIRIAAARAGALTVTIFAGNEKAYYARFVEFGTAPHTQAGQFAGTQHPGTAAQPFFFPSFRAMRKEVRRMLAKAVREAVRKAVK
jgi:HK97 gp10 family phage protein